MVAIQEDCDIDVDDVALLQRTVVRDAVAHTLVHTCAHTLGECAVVEWRWVCSIVNDHLMHGL
eukprot:365377-Chlamydomonas_euryale.AAC.42